jgi:hypothetical protein
MANAVARRAAPASDSEIVEALLALRRQFANELAAAKAAHAEQLAAAQATHAKALTEVKASFAAEKDVLTRELAAARNELQKAGSLIERYRYALQSCAAAGALAANALE